MKKRSWFICNIIVLCICFNSCSNYKVRKAIRHFQGKELIMDGCRYQIKAGILEDYETEISFAPITLVSYIDEKLCTHCLTNYLNVSLSFINSFQSDSVKYICVAYPRPIPELHEAIKDFDDDQIQVYYDKDNLFYKKNSLKLLNDNAPRSFLVTGKGVVLYVGDPVTAKPVADLYKLRIMQMLNDEMSFQ